MNKYNREAIQKTINLWQPYSNEKLTEAGAIKIPTSVGRYFNVLARVAARQKQSGTEKQHA